jgi:hypothetical protein
MLTRSREKGEGKLEYRIVFVNDMVDMLHCQYNDLGGVGIEHMIMDENGKGDGLDSMLFRMRLRRLG